MKRGEQGRIDVSTEICAGTDSRKINCLDSPKNECCPSGRAKPACSKGQPGICIDVRTEMCVGTDTKTGYCAGAANIECCPSFKAQPACSKGQPGTCIDVDTEVCLAADTKEGYCEGSSNIKCCPSSRIKPKGTIAIPLELFPKSREFATNFAKKQLDDVFWGSKCAEIPPDAVAIVVKMGTEVREPYYESGIVLLCATQFIVSVLPTFSPIESGWLCSAANALIPTFMT